MTPIKERVVEDGKILAAAGVSAGLDMALILADKLAGRDLAETLQLGIEYDSSPPFDPGSPDKANPAIVSALRARFVYWLNLKLQDRFCTHHIFIFKSIR